MEHETRTELPSTDQTQARRALHIALLRRAGGPLLSAVLLCLALWALHAMASEVTYRQIAGYVHTLPNTDIGLAVLLTGAGYAVMTLYDWFGLASIGRRLPARRVGLISLISYAFSNALGMSLLISGSIRYRFYVQAGLSTGEIGRVVLYTRSASGSGWPPSPAARCCSYPFRRTCRCRGCAFRWRSYSCSFRSHGSSCP